MRSSRLFEIIYLLMDKHFATCEELACELEVSARTIRRDIEVLSAAGVPVYMARGKGGGVHLMPHYVLDKSVVSDKEQTEILAALSALRSTGVSDDLSVLERLSRLFHREAIDWLDIDLSFWGAPPEFKHAYELIKEAIITCHLLQFAYYDVNGKATERMVEPVKLVFKEHSWYMRAYCLKRNDWRTFKLFRMDVERMQLLPETFKPRVDEGVFDSLTSSKGTDELSLLFEKGAEHRVREEFAPDSITVREDGRFLVEVDVTLDDRTCSYLLSFGAELEVLKPSSVRKYLAHQAQSIFELYHTNK